MSFSISDIKLKNKQNTVQDDIKSCFAMINNIPILNQNVTYALKEYLKYVIKHRRTRRIKVESIKEMIDELLEKCCRKNIKDITSRDVDNNENEILYQIKGAIYYGATKHIYNPYEEEMTSLNISKIRTNILPPQRITSRKLDSEQVKIYFEELDTL